MSDESKDKGFATDAVHLKDYTCPTTGSLVTPIYQTNSYEFEDVEDGAKKCEDYNNGHCYTRVSNPTQSVFEEKIAALEGGEAAIAFASGTAAVSGLLFYCLEQGTHAIVDETSYSSTHYLFNHTLKKFGVETTFVDTSDPSNVEEAIKSNTEIIYFESPANPTLKLVDIEKMAEIGKEHGILTAIDSTFATPCLQNPLKSGIDIVIHSATKYICGHGDAMGGVLIGRDKELVDEIRDDTLKNLGGITAPYNAYNFARGLRTIDLRVRKHCENAMEVAKFLEEHPKIKRVFYPGLPSHPQHELAKRQMSDYGGIICFEVRGGLESGKTLMESVELCTLAVSLGHVETLIEHPASMTHYYVPKEEREASGITDGLVRISVGLEEVEDIIDDLDQALADIEL